jgi:hypothetical protein
MIVGMTICAPVMLQRVSKFSFMTNPAVNHLMFPLKNEVCLAVIKSVYPFYCLERILGMALPAILTKLILVRISMAVGAIRELYSPEFLEFFATYHLNFMAIKAIDTFMFPGQFES